MPLSPHLYFIRILASCAVLFFLFSCQHQTLDSVQLIRTNFASLPNWQDDEAELALQAFAHSCTKITRMPDTQPLGIDAKMGTAKDLKMVCSALKNQYLNSRPAARTFFEKHFNAFHVQQDKHHDALITGYYEPTLRGALHATANFSSPLRKRPADLITVDLAQFDAELKGKQIIGRLAGNTLEPYPTRAQIESQPSRSDDTVLWLANDIDKFFLQIQGSGLIELENKQLQRVGYAGNNGRSYTAIGRQLIAEGEISREQMSMQSIRAWLESHPEKAKTLMNSNERYIFFRAINSNGPIGAQGVNLTAGRSLAIDPKIYSYGLPMFINAEHPLKEKPLQQLMIAQDTGSAITGALRADFFWGNGANAEAAAGPMKSHGEIWLLAPKIQGVQP